MTLQHEDILRRAHLVHQTSVRDSHGSIDAHLHANTELERQRRKADRAALMSGDHQKLKVLRSTLDHDPDAAARVRDIPLATLDTADANVLSWNVHKQQVQRERLAKTVASVNTRLHPSVQKERDVLERRRASLVRRGAKAPLAEELRKLKISSRTAEECAERLSRTALRYQRPRSAAPAKEKSKNGKKWAVGGDAQYSKIAEVHKRINERAKSLPPKVRVTVRPPVKRDRDRFKEARMYERGVGGTGAIIERG